MADRHLEQAVLVAAIAVMIGLSLWLQVNFLKPKLHQTTPVISHEPDYYIESMVRTTTGISGEVKNILRAELVEHFPDDDSTELASPHLEIYNGRIEPWHVVALFRRSLPRQSQTAYLRPPRWRRHVRVPTEMRSQLRCRQKDWRPRNLRSAPLMWMRFVRDPHAELRCGPWLWRR